MIVDPFAYRTDADEPLEGNDGIETVRTEP
jgi:hypothetical protein